MLFAAFALHFFHGSFEHGGVKFKADGFDVAALFAAQHVPGPAQFQVEGGNFEACSEVAEFLKRSEAAARDVGQFAARAG